MTKQEILEAIDATIVPNDKKAITADSLANLLREMASATPENSGDGEGGDTSLRLLLPDALIAQLFLEMGLPCTREGWNEVKLSLGGMGFSDSSIEKLDAYYNKMFDNNVEVCKQIQEAAAENKGVSVVGDMSEGSSISYKAVNEDMSGVTVDYANISIQFSFDCLFLEIGIMGGKQAEFFLCSNSEMLNDWLIGNRKSMAIIILPDGGLAFEPFNTEYEVFVAENDEVLSEEQKGKNDEYRLTSTAEFVTFYYQPSGGSEPYRIYPISVNTEANKLNYIIGINVFQSTIESGGNVSTTLIGSLNIPQ